MLTGAWQIQEEEMVVRAPLASGLTNASVQLHCIRTKKINRFTNVWSVTVSQMLQISLTPQNTGQVLKGKRHKTECKDLQWRSPLLLFRLPLVHHWFWALHMVKCSWRYVLWSSYICYVKPIPLRKSNMYANHVNRKYIHHWFWALHTVREVMALICEMLCVRQLLQKLHPYLKKGVSLHN